MTPYIKYLIEDGGYRYVITTDAVDLLTASPEIMQAFKDVWATREDAGYSTFNQWLGYAQTGVDHEGAITIVKYRHDNVPVGICTVTLGTTIHYGEVLDVYGLVDTEGSPRGFIKAIRKLCKRLGIRVYSRSKYLKPHHYLHIYTEVL